MGVVDDYEGMDNLLEISTPVIFPLTNEQKQQLNDPANFSYEEEFYILYDSLTGMIVQFLQAQKILDFKEVEGIVGLLFSNVDVEERYNHGLKAMAVAYWAGVNINGVPLLEKGQLLQPEKSLDIDKVAWGRAIRDIIDKDEILTSIWALRLDELTSVIQTYVDVSGDAEVLVFDIPENMRDNITERAKVEAERASHHLAMIDITKNKWMPLWGQGRNTDSDGVRFVDDIVKIQEEYIKNHKSELQFLQRKKTAADGRISKRLEELGKDPTFQKQNKKKEKPSLPEVIRVLSGMEDLCDNPDCPIHGGEVRRRRTAENNQTTINQQKQISDITPKTTEQNTMASDKITHHPLPDKKTVAKDRKFTSVAVQFVYDPNSKSIRLPEGMSYDEAHYWLTTIEQEETRTFQFEFKFVGWNIMDAVWAVYQASVQLLGFAHIQDEEKHSFFGSWKVPPRLITIPTGPKTTQQVPWGPIEVSGLSAALQPSIDTVENQFVLRLSAEIKNNERQLADKLMRLAIEHLANHSIYRGKAIEMNFESMQPGNFASFDPNKAPKFLDLGDPAIDELVLPKKVQRLVNVALWTPIRKTSEARKHKVPLRRTVTLAGPHGTGKTLTALATAKLAVEHGWTFLYLRELSQLKEALHFAKNYFPCVVFAEDVDTIVSGERDEKMNEVFNIVDGVDRKHHDVMLVFSTNCIEDIHQGMLRPGRTDTIIPFTPPDEEAVNRLMRIYGRGLIDPEADLTAIARRLSGQIPAVIREAVEYSKLAAIEDNTGNRLIVRPEHLEAAVDQMLVHAQLLQEPKQDRPDMEVLGEALGRVIVNGLNFHTVDPTEGMKTLAREGVRDIIEEANLRSNSHDSSNSNG